MYIAHPPETVAILAENGYQSLRYSCQVGRVFPLPMFPATRSTRFPASTRGPATHEQNTGLPACVDTMYRRGLLRTVGTLTTDPGPAIRRVLRRLDLPLGRSSRSSSSGTGPLSTDRPDMDRWKICRRLLATSSSVDRAISPTAATSLTARSFPLYDELRARSRLLGVWVPLGPASGTSILHRRWLHADMRILNLPRAVKREYDI